MAGRSVMPLFYQSWNGARAASRTPLRPPPPRGKALVPSALTAAALRVPERAMGQLPFVFPSAAPQIYVHEGARQALERRLTAAHPGPVILSITDNRHSIISHKLTNGVLKARVHHMFLGAPRGIMDALVRYVVRGEKAASNVVGDFIEAHGSRIVKRPRKVHLVTQGKHHDLLTLVQDLNERYFDGQCNMLVTWGKHVPRRSKKARSTIKLGSYTQAERLIRVHPVLDRKWVPRYFVAFVVYHEMLHHMMPASRGVGRVMLHPPEFRDRERKFRHYERAVAWERAHIARLLRA